ncbi:hypothetical protein K7X08_002834 [Anisodus acutangulus]|uniref:Putative plant transposon protein domain-containing protein n=1 Tax=Anisodus acutangulus TaxID=402998 RepID=A0A9Q1ME98_9SOLA|nr:hypothetical protein K7X08_002834 [Anisodus acutangulus]
MGPRRATSKVSSSRGPVNLPPRADYDKKRFANKDAQDMYNKLCTHSLVLERGMEFQTAPYKDAVYERIRAMIVDKETINAICGVTNLLEKEEEEDDFMAWKNSEIDWVEVAETVGYPGARFTYTYDAPKCMLRCQFNKVVKAWLYFVSARLIPSTHLYDILVDHIKLVYAIMKGFSVDVGRAINNNLNWICRLNTTARLGHRSLITALCDAHGVPESSNDIKGRVRNPLTRTIVNAYSDPTPEPTPGEGNHNRPKRQQREQDEEAEEPGQISQPPPLAIEDGYTQRLDQLFQQNQYIIQQNQYLIQH